MGKENVGDWYGDRRLVGIVGWDAGWERHSFVIIYSLIIILNRAKNTTI